MRVFIKAFGFRTHKDIDLSSLDPDFKKQKDGSVEVYNDGELVAIVPKEEVALIATAIDKVK